MRRSAGRRPDPVVAHGDRDGVLVAGQRDLDRAALAVLEGVDDEVAQDALDPAGVDLGDAPASAGATRRPALPRRSASGCGRSTTRSTIVAQVDGLGVERGGAGVEPADLEQVGQQRPRTGRAAPAAARRPRPSAGSKPVRDSWMTSAGHPDASSAGCAARATRRRRTAAAPATAPRAGGSGVCRLSAISLNDVGRAGPGRPRRATRIRSSSRPDDEPLGDARGLPHRGDDLAGDDPGDRADAAGRGRGRRRRRCGDEVEGLLLAAACGKTTVQLVRPPASGRPRRWPPTTTARRPSAVDGRSVRPMASGLLLRGSCADGLAQLGRDRVGVEPEPPVRTASDDAGVVPASAAGRRSGRLGSASPASWCDGVGRPARRGRAAPCRCLAVSVEAARRLRCPLSDLDGRRRRSRSGHEAVGDPLEQETAARRGRRRRPSSDGRRHDAQLQRRAASGAQADRAGTRRRRRRRSPRGTDPARGRARCRAPTPAGRAPDMASRARPCSRRRARSRRSRGARGRARSWSAAAARGR